MIESVAKASDKVTFRVTVRRVAVYFDNFAIIAFAKERGPLRDRFIAALQNGADLLFSGANASEIVGPTQQTSQDAIREFFDGVGPYWTPVEMDVVEVMNREACGGGRESCVANLLLQQFFAGRNIVLHGEQRLDLVPPEFLNLGHFLDWLIPQRDEIRKSLAKYDAILGDRLSRDSSRVRAEQAEIRSDHAAADLPRLNSGRIMLDWTNSTVGTGRSSLSVETRRQRRLGSCTDGCFICAVCHARQAVETANRVVAEAQFAGCDLLRTRTGQVRQRHRSPPAPSAGPN